MKRITILNDYDLEELGMKISHAIKNNLDDLQSYGITQQLLDEFNAVLEDFSKTQPGAIARYDTTTAREDKDKVKFSLLEQIKEMSIRFILLWGSDSLEYKELGIKYLSPQQEEKIIITAKNLSKAVADNFAALANLGLTQEIADRFNETIQSFENKIQELSRAKLSQKKQTEIKTEKANELYKLIKKYSQIGKTYFRNKSYASYKLFLIFSYSMGTLEAPVNIRFEPAEMMLKWDHVTRAISYRVEYSADGENFEKLKATKKEYLSLEKMETVNGFYRIKARNNQNYGPYSEVFIVEEG